MSHDLDASVVAVIAACVVVWGLFSARLGRLNITAPIAFVVLGLIVTHGPVWRLQINLHSSTVRIVAELTLALVLFSDASRVNVRVLGSHAGIPGRLLGIGLPLTIGAGTLAAAALIGGSGLWVAALVAAILAPTDAALGSAILQDERVPSFVRRALNVESGLNDGIATPFVNIFLAGALSEEVHYASGVVHAVLALLGGAGIGIGVGLVGGLALRHSRAARWGEAAFRPLIVLGLALFSYAAALSAGANGFVAAFVAGMAYGAVVHDASGDLHFTEDSAELLSLLVWFSFGAVMLVPGFEQAGWPDLVFALLALTLVRMVPVGIALLGTGLDRVTVAFLGWFGPRGLASVVFGLVAVDSLDSAAANRVLAVVTVTVTLSVLAHGLSASPLGRRYGAFASSLHEARREHTTTAPLPTRSLDGLLPRPAADS